MARRNEAADRAKATREARRDREVEALESELAGYEARLKGTRDEDEAAMLKGRISDVKSEITRAKKGHGTGPKTRVTDPTGGSNPPPAAAE